MGDAMRTIEHEIIDALRKQNSFSTAPMVNNYYGKNPDGQKQRRDSLQWSENFSGIFTYKLWGHAIAHGDNIVHTLLVSDCGYATATTKSRLNAVFAALDIPMACSVRKGKMVYYLNGKETQEKEIKTGEWTVTVS